MNVITLKGGPGSGNYGHAGRPGLVGGSQHSYITADMTAQERWSIGQPWIDNLTQPEKDAIHRWGITSTNIRKVQIGNTDGMSEAEKRTALLDAPNFESALDKGVEYHGTIYRGLHDLPSSVIESWLDKGEIIFNSDQSSTYNADMGVDFSSSGRLENNSVLFIMDQHSGVSLFDTTHVTMGGKPITEYEVVARKGTQYKITGYDYILKDGRSFRNVKGPDYFEGTEFSWPDNPPPNWKVNHDFEGHFVISMREL